MTRQSPVSAGRHLSLPVRQGPPVKQKKDPGKYTRTPIKAVAVAVAVTGAGTGTVTGTVESSQAQLSQNGETTGLNPDLPRLPNGSIRFAWIPFSELPPIIDANLP